jgi:hypothetical protein
MALAAQRGRILRLFLAKRMRWATIGGFAGIARASVLMRFTRAILFEISAYDPKVLLIVLAVLSAVILLACGVPALRRRLRYVRATWRLPWTSTPKPTTTSFWPRRT